MPETLANFIPFINGAWRKLIGTPLEFALEARVFHSISLLAILLMALYVPYNLFAGLYIASLSCFIFCVIFFYEYYRSRFWHRPYRSVIFGISGLVLLSFNYFANAGIQGSTDIIWPGYLLFLLTICPYRHLLTWVGIYLFTFGMVHVAEYLHPEWVQYPFSVGDGQFTDRITAFPLPVISLAIVVGLFRRNYDRERATVAQRDQEKTRLLSILSHDLRAPFIQVQQYLELLDNNELSATERAGIEQTLKQNNDQTLHLITNLLYWSRSQLDGSSVNLVTLNLLTIIQQTLDLSHSLSDKKHITLRADIDPEIQVIADADMLQVVIRNLLQNAVKFTPPGGSIRIETEVSDSICRISVSDTGKGISAAQMQVLFSGAIASVGTANEKGVGLGLQLCKEFMEKMGGGIEAFSVEGEGARFAISVPVVGKTSHDYF